MSKSIYDLPNLKSITVSKRIHYIDWEAIDAPNAQVFFPSLENCNNYTVSVDFISRCKELRIENFLFKAPSNFNLAFSSYLRGIRDKKRIRELAIFISLLDNLQDHIAFFDRKYKIFHTAYQELIKTCNEFERYENQIILTEYKQKYYPETIENTIKRKFSL